MEVARLTATPAACAGAGKHFGRPHAPAHAAGVAVKREGIRLFAFIQRTSPAVRTANGRAAFLQCRNEPWTICGSPG